MTMFYEVNIESTRFCASTRSAERNNNFHEACKLNTANELQ